MSRRIAGPLVAAVAIVAIAGGHAHGAQGASGPADRPAAVGPDAAGPDRPPVEVRALVNRTAVSVGDPILWTVELVCAPMVDVVADDLAGETLNLDGLELVNTDVTRTTEDDGGLVHRMTYELRTYEIDRTALRVAPFAVRYFVRRPGQRAEDLEPAGQVTVPGLLLAWHSTIPKGITSVDLREQRPAESVPTLLAVSRPIGLTLVVVSFAPVAFWGVSRLRRVRLPRVRHLTVRASRRQARKALQNLLNAETSTETARRNAYGQLNGVLRRFLAATTALPARSLSLDKLTAWLEGAGSTPARKAIAEALAECDRACFGPADRVPSDDQFRDSVAVLERVL